jgi:hypothetical protein
VAAWKELWFFSLTVEFRKTNLTSNEILIQRVDSRVRHFQYFKNFVDSIAQHSSPTDPPTMTFDRFFKTDDSCGLPDFI